MRLILASQLKAECGIVLSDTQRWRKENDGTFPKAIKVGFRKYYVAEEIAAYLAAIVAARDAGTEESNADTSLNAVAQAEALCRADQVPRRTLSEKCTPSSRQHHPRKPRRVLRREMQNRSGVLGGRVVND